MRKAARIAGLIWIALSAIAGIVLMATGLLRGNRGDLYVIFGAALPGLLLLRWGRGPRAPSPPAVRKREPIDAAAEAGHVLTLKTPPESCDIPQG